MIKAIRFAAVLTLAVLFQAGMVLAQSDPGVQSGNRGTGLALPSVLTDDNPGILAFFNDGLLRFQEVDSVANGLGTKPSTARLRVRGAITRRLGRVIGPSL